MRVLVFHNFYRSSRPSGENNAVLADARAMQAAGHDVLLARRDSDDVVDAGLLKKIGAAVSTVYSVEGRRSAAAVIRDFRPQVAHLHNLTPLWSQSVADALQEADVPRVQVLHNYRLSCLNGSHMLDGAPCYRCLGKHLPLPGVVHRCYNGSLAGSTVIATANAVNRIRAETADWYLAVSSIVRERAVQHGLRADRVSVKPEYLIADRELPTAAGDHLLYVGRLDVNKGVLLLLDAFDRYRGSGGRLPLRIAGSGPLEAEVKRRAEGRPELQVLGQLAADEARVEIAAARAVVSPALWAEPFGLTVLEAWREGRPAVVTDLGGPGEMVDDATGWVVASEVEQVAAALRQAEDADEAQRRGSRGADLLRSRFSAAAVLQAYEHAWTRSGAQASEKLRRGSS